MVYALSAGLLATLFGRESLSAALPAALQGLTARLAAGVASAPILALTKGVGNAMLMDKVRSVLIGLTFAGVFCAGVGVVVFRGVAGEPPAQTVPPQAYPPAIPTVLSALPPRPQAVTETLNFRVTAASSPHR